MDTQTFFKANNKTNPDATTNTCQDKVTMKPGIEPGAAGRKPGAEPGEVGGKPGAEPVSAGGKPGVDIKGKNLFSLSMAPKYNSGYLRKYVIVARCGLLCQSTEDF